MATNGDVYWIGSDGNIWFKGSQGVQNWGSAKDYQQVNGGLHAYSSSSNPYAKSLADGPGFAAATKIADPNPPAPAPNTTGNGSNYEDRTNDIKVQQAGLDAANAQEDSGLAAVDKALGSLLGKYDTEKTANEKNYHTQSTTNNQNLQKNRQSAYVNAAQGRQGLFSTLASLGALSGSGIDLANRAVQNGANADLAGAEATYGENQQGLDTAIGTFRQQDKMRREDASTAADNAKMNVRNRAAQNRQKFYSNLVDDYTKMGNTDRAAYYTDLAAKLFPTLAKTSVPDSNIAYTAAAFTPGTLSSYIGGQNSTQVSARPNDGGAANSGYHLPGLVATTQSRKKERSGARA